MKKKSSAKELLQKLATLAALIILCAIFWITMPDKFPKIANIMNILKQASINCLIASGMLCCLITAGIDLSVGSNCVLCTCTIGVLVQNFGITNPVILILIGLLFSYSSASLSTTCIKAGSISSAFGYEERAVGSGTGHHRFQVHRLHQHWRGFPDVDRRRFHRHRERCCR